MENKTIRTLLRIGQTHLFTLDYHDDYKFDDFLKTGAVSDDEVKHFVATNLLTKKHMDFNLPDFGCSTFSADLRSGEKIFGRNFDQQDCMQLVLTTRPQNAYSSISVVNLSYIGFFKETFDEHNTLDNGNLDFLLAAPYVPMDGVNEKGLAVGILMLRKQATSQKRGNIPLTSTTAMRMILDKCSCTNEAVEMLSQYDMNSSANVDFHFQISDKHGKSVVVEYIDNEMHVKDVPYVTNFPLTSDEAIGSGHDRYQKMKDTLDQNNGVFETQEQAMTLLEAVSNDGTRWSSIYNLTSPSLMLSVDRDYSEFHSFVLN